MLIAPLFKPDNPTIFKKIRPILQLMTNACKRSRNPLLNVFLSKTYLCMEENHHTQENIEFGGVEKAIGGTTNQ